MNEANPVSGAAMRKVDVDSIRPGDTAPCDLYSAKGELLISSGVTLTALHIETIQRRNILELYAPVSEDEEIQELVRKQLHELGELDVAEAAAGESGVTTEAAPPKPVRQAKAMQSARFQAIRAGREGLEQLKQSPRATDLDDNLRKERTSDRPIGPALKGRAQEQPVARRQETYKKKITTSYGRALEDVTRLLDGLSDGRETDGHKLRGVVDEFVKIYISDRNILLNISGTKHHDEYLYHHSLNVCLLSINIAASAGYSERQVVEIGMGALVHDVGMLLLPPAIRHKEGKLVQEEWYEVQKHPILGLHLLEKVKSLPDSVPYVSYQVHERENGSGYPKQRTARLVHRFAKIVQVADVYEAMSSPRPHRQAHIPYAALTNLIKLARHGLLSDECVKAFLEYASLFPVGSLVQLNDGRIAKVVAANPMSAAKPILSVLTDTDAVLLPEDKAYHIDLMKDTETHVLKALANDHLGGMALMDGF